MKDGWKMIWESYEIKDMIWKGCEMWGMKVEKWK